MEELQDNKAIAQLFSSQKALSTVSANWKILITKFESERHRNIQTPTCCRGYYSRTKHHRIEELGLVEEEVLAVLPAIVYILQEALHNDRETKNLIDCVMHHDNLAQMVSLEQLKLSSVSMLMF